MCDTFVVMGSHTRNGRTLLCKNSDRDPNEAQRIERFEGAAYPPGAQLRCTYIDIPQVAQTYTVLGSRPWWMWGFEQGMNEHGLAIGNEAVWSQLAASAAPGLLGMDLVRLMLERAKTADEALEVLSDLLTRHGQSGRTSLIRNKTYHNAFILADHDKAWVVETAGPQWAARQVSAWAAISNLYAIGTNYDRLSEGAIAFAVQNGWYDQQRDGAFDFARAYADPAYEKLPSCAARLALSKRRLAGTQDRGTFSLSDAFGVLRAHNDNAGSDARPRGIHTLCMHATVLGESETAASAVMELPPHGDDAAPVFWASQNSPCLSSFVPLWLDGPIPAAWSGPQGEGDLWWQLEMLQRQIELDYDSYAPIAVSVLNLAETAALQAVAALPPAATRATREQLMLGLTERRSQAIGQIAALIEMCISAIAPPPACGPRAELNAGLSHERSRLWP